MSPQKELPQPQTQHIAPDFHYDEEDEGEGEGEGEGDGRYYEE